MAAESGLVWPPGRSCGALSGRDVAPGTCRAGGLRLGPVGAAWHLPGPTIGLRGASDGPFRPPGIWLLHRPWPFGAVWPPAGVGPSELTQPTDPWTPGVLRPAGRNGPSEAPRRPMVGPGRCLAGPKGARPLPTDPMGPLGPCRAHRPAPVAGRALMGARIGHLEASAWALCGRDLPMSGCRTTNPHPRGGCLRSLPYASV